MWGRNRMAAEYGHKWNQGGVCGVASPASAAGFSLGRPTRRTKATAARAARASDRRRLIRGPAATAQPSPVARNCPSRGSRANGGPPSRACDRLRRLLTLQPLTRIWRHWGTPESDSPSETYSLSHVVLPEPRYAHPCRGLLAPRSGMPPRQDH
jgi:hypothetical protein